MGRFGLQAVRPAASVARGLRGDAAQALFAGNAAHSFLALEAWGTAAFGIMLSVAGHAVGWPVARGGSQRMADALVAHFRSLGGEVQVGEPVVVAFVIVADASLVVVVIGVDQDFDVEGLPLEDLRQVARLGGDRLPTRYRQALERYRYGAAAFKLDWALDGPVPWTAPACLRAATVHLGGTLEEVAASEAAHERGEVHDRPFVLFVQPTLFDPTRAPEGRHTAWAYCHVPFGSALDVTDRIERQVERFAPGFRERILKRSVLTPADLERRNANLVGGEINGGRMDMPQIFARPVARPTPYRTPVRGVYLCSASTPPGGGVHGMGGYFAATAALADLRP